MDLDLLRNLGQVAGLAGLGIGVFLLLAKDVIRKRVFAKLTDTQAYALLKLIITLAWSIAVFGILVWGYLEVSRGNSIPGGERDPNRYISIGVREGMTFEAVVKLVTQEQNVTITFDSTCDALRTSRIDGGQVSADDTERFLTNLGLRIAGPVPSYRVRSISQVRYEISCD